MVKRYSVDWVFCEECDTGEYVRYDDHAAEVARLEAERDAALAEIDRIKENVRREAKAKTITLELPSDQNGHCFYITAPWSESEERLAKELSAVAELVTDLSKHIIDSEVVKHKTDLDTARAEVAKMRPVVEAAGRYFGLELTEDYDALREAYDRYENEKGGQRC